MVPDDSFGWGAELWQRVVDKTIWNLRKGSLTDKPEAQSSARFKKKSSGTVRPLGTAALPGANRLVHTSPAGWEVNWAK
jgi:hypothetical protein